MNDATAKALLQAVLERPEDDTPRLILADRLDDLGESVRAEFIRVQCEIARLITSNRSPRPAASLCNRMSELRKRENEIFPLSPFTEAQITWYRGFVYEVECTANDWFSHEVVGESHPINSVHLTTCPKLNGNRDAIVKSLEARWPAVAYWRIPSVTLQDLLQPEVVRSVLERIKTPLHRRNLSAWLAMKPR